MKKIFSFLCMVIALHTGAQQPSDSNAMKIVNQLFAEKALAKKEALLAQFKKEFPKENPDYAYFAMTYTLAKEKEHEKEAVKYTRMIRGKYMRLMSDFHTGANIAQLDPGFAAPFLKKEINRFKYIENPGKDSLSEQNKFAYYRMLYEYGGILIKKGKDKEALPYLQKAYDGFFSDRDPELSAKYAQLLSKLNKYEQAFPILDKLVKDGKGNAEIKKQLETAYARLNPGKDAAAYVSAIDQEVIRRIREESLKHVMNDPSPAFVVQDEKGNNVSLADFKGKTIVLDFWATWCGPCKKSFPAMQRVVNKYRNAPDVKFLFIDTWERTETPLQNAKEFLDSHNYTFDLYLDPKDSSGNNNKAVSLFGIKGIPQKYVIDAKGNIRFNVEGFDDGDDATVEELSAMIEYTRKNS